MNLFLDHLKNELGFHLNLYNSAIREAAKLQFLSAAAPNVGHEQQKQQQLFCLVVGDDSEFWAPPLQDFAKGGWRLKVASQASSLSELEWMPNLSS